MQKPGPMDLGLLDHFLANFWTIFWVESCLFRGVDETRLEEVKGKRRGLNSEVVMSSSYFVVNYLNLYSLCDCTFSFISLIKHLLHSLP